MIATLSFQLENHNYPFQTFFKKNPCYQHQKQTTHKQKAMTPCSSLIERKAEHVTEAFVEALKPWSGASWCSTKQLLRFGQG